MLPVMDSRRRRPRSSLSTSRFRPFAGGGAAADLVELHLPSLRVVRDIAVPSAPGDHYHLIDHARLAAVLYARCPRTTASRPSRLSDRALGGNL